MRKGVLLLIARQFWTDVFKTRAIYLLLGTLAVLLFLSAYGGYRYLQQNRYRIAHQEMARKSWEANPDKHPHRMAHFGTFAFRPKHPLSAFDFGTESYTGNAVFLEAHRQNTVNFSEASFSTGLLRFGELSMAMVLQVLLPLVLFFVGYRSIVEERQNGTLKVLFAQGVRWKEILVGKSLGLTAVGLLLCLPYLVTILVILVATESASSDLLERWTLLVLAYLLFTFVLCLITVGISANSHRPQSALVKLLGLWLLLVVLLPRTALAIGAYWHKSPNKLAFKTGIEAEVIQLGDSHDPDDPHYRSLKDSVLKAHQVESVQELPFNYGGFQMREGEKISAEIYQKHEGQLLNQYRKQNQWSEVLGLLDPYLALKNLSMALSGTDFESYVTFQKQAEDYRYGLAQHMNELQMTHISPTKVSGSEGKAHVVPQAEWQAFPDFNFQPPSLAHLLGQQLLSIASLLLWFGLSIGMIAYSSQHPKIL